MTGPIIGWDIGGANVKAARFDAANGTLLIEQPFALWREPQRLSEVLRAIAGRLGPARAMGVTMTAELADCFATKREGVGVVLDAVQRAFPAVPQWVYGVDGRFRRPDAARRQPHRVAAANWMASATVAAQRVPNALFVDVGSTTTDIIPLVGGRVCVSGRTDPTRLRSGELVYTGALRTPICAIVRTVPLDGRRCRVAAEHFAIAADAHLWLGHITERDYTCETPDGRGRSREDVGARLARMVCADLEMLDAEGISAIARTAARAQVRQLASAMRQVLRRLAAPSPHQALIVGRGAFLAQAAAAEVGLDVRAGLAATDTPHATPAAAVAYLLARDDQH
jgi:(4-(4-[2-(gamma-L-glutamylamino)ethyl]phenoxymethyl)furan-2-yl)methanamine synthase